MRKLNKKRLSVLVGSNNLEHRTVQRDIIVNESQEQCDKRREHFHVNWSKNHDPYNAARQVASTSVPSQQEFTRTSSTLKTQQNTEDTTRIFGKHIQKLKLLAARVLLNTNTDYSCKINTQQNALVCLVCDCFVIRSFEKLQIMSMGDVKNTVID